MWAGYSQQTRGVWNRWRSCFEQAANMEELPVLEKKKFKPRFPEIPVLESYKEEAGQRFWDKFPCNMDQSVKPMFSYRELGRMADENEGVNMDRVRRVIGYLARGADIGCRGVFRTGTVSGNAASAYESGPEVSDAIAGWMADGYAYGPVNEEEVPAHAKVSGIMVRKKPNGAARVILNLSAPKGMSVNDGVEAEQFPAVMSSTTAWLRVLAKAGRGALMSKTDWASAYKQIPVRPEDTDLQWFEWAGKFFKELCLIFGCASSAGIFDDAAKAVLELVCLISGFSMDMVCQHLDDMCAAASRREDVAKFDSCFMEVARRLGVKLAPRDDHDKTFGPCQRGVVFGIEYDTIEWTWALKPDKLLRIVEGIREALACKELSEKKVQSLVGKLINVRPLIPAGRFNCDQVMALLADSHKGPTVAVPDSCKRQLRFWEVTLLACNGRLSIPDPDERVPPWALNIYTDAAGGTLESPGRGTGGVLMEGWFYIPWSASVNGGAWRIDGKKVGRKLSALELIGPLIAITVFARRCQSQPVRIWVDNAGSVGVWKKGYSGFCALCTTVVKAISVVAAGLGCHLVVEKVTRCSTAGAVLADLASKGRCKEMFQYAGAQGWRLDAAPAAVPEVLLKWVCLPAVDDELGHRVLQYLASTGVEVLGYH